MTKRYARIASAQVKQAVNGLDTMLQAVHETETGDGLRRLIQETSIQPDASSLTP
jgi:hypothetical protein